MARPKVSHLIATKRILRYIRGALDYGIMFPSADQGKKLQAEWIHRFKLVWRHR